MESRMFHVLETGSRLLVLLTNNDQLSFTAHHDMASVFDVERLIQAVQNHREFPRYRNTLRAVPLHYRGSLFDSGCLTVVNTIREYHLHNNKESGS